MIYDPKLFAVAVRDGTDLFLVWRIRRNRKGAIFLLIPRSGMPQSGKKWDPHVSFHENGTLFVKSYDERMVERNIQKPDRNFVGTQDLWTTPLASKDPRLTNIPCKVQHFAEVFEIPVDLLRRERLRAHLSVSVVESGLSPKYPPGPFLAQHVFMDDVPWIVVSLVDSSSIDAGESISGGEVR